MREKQFVKGSSSDAKFASIEATLRHFSHRLGRKVIGLIPATPIIRFVVPDAEGAILNMICPADGRITQGCIFVSSEEPKISLEFQLKRKDKMETSMYDIKANVSLPFRFDLEVELGDMVTLWIYEPEKVKNVWIGFLYEVGIEGLRKRDIPIKQIEEMIEEDNHAGTCEEGRRISGKHSWECES